MKVLAGIAALMDLVAIVFLFINWRISLGLFIFACVLQALPYGPDFLLNATSGCLVIAGFIYLFINWRKGVGFILLGYVVTRFRLWARQKNIEYYAKHPAPEV